MKHSEVMTLLRYIKGAYPRFEMTEDAVDVWYDFLKDYPFETAREGLKKHIEESAFQPTISDIKKLSRKDPEQYVDYEKLREETQNNLSQMDEWMRSSTMKGDVH